MEYIALAEGLSKRKLIPLKHNIRDYIGAHSDKDCYTSLYKYNDSHYRIFKETGSLAGIKDVKTNRLVFDFDNDSDIEKARDDASELYTRLLHEGIPKENIGAYFSGNKGFHVEVRTKEEFKQYKDVIMLSFRRAF